jgi:hypothetical protein
LNVFELQKEVWSYESKMNVSVKFEWKNSIYLNEKIVFIWMGLNTGSPDRITRRKEKKEPLFWCYKNSRKVNYDRIFRLSRTKTKIY